MKKRSKPLSHSRKTYVDNNGYNRYKGSNTTVHRHAAEKMLGRTLKDGEVVHHKNRNKQDNSFNNLQVFSSQSEHWKAHKRDAANHGWKYSLTGKDKRSR